MPVSRELLQEICDEMARELGVAVSVCGKRARIVAASARQRIGAVQAGGARVMGGKLDEHVVSTAQASGSLTLSEGCLLPVDFEGERLIGIRVEAPLENARPYCRIARCWVLSHLQAAPPRAPSPREQGRVEDFMDSSPLGFVVYREDLKPLYANAAYARMLGWGSPEELMAVASPALAFAPAERERMARYAAALLRGEPAPARWRVACLRRDGSPRWLEVAPRLADWSGEPALQCMVVEVTAQVQAEREAAEKRAQLQAAFDAMPCGICLFDEDLNVVAYNDLFLKLRGYSEALLARCRSMPSLLRHAAERGDFGDRDAEAVIAERKAKLCSGKTLIDEVALADGTVVEVRGNRRPGGGYVLTHTDITERRRVEQVLRDSERQLLRILDISPIGVAVANRAGRILFMNLPFARMSGSTPEKLLHTDAVADYVDPRDRERLVEAVYRDGEANDYVAQLRRVDGSLWWALIYWRRIEFGGEPAHIGWRIDITDRVEAERARRDSEARFRDFAEVASDWWWEMDAGLRYTYISDRVYQVLGIPPSRFLGRRRDEITADDIGAPRWRAHLEDLRNHRRFRNFEWSIIAPTGDRLILRANAKPVLDEQGRFRGYRGTGTDVTVQKRAEEELHRASAQALEASRIKSEFLANMSHELRTPLNAIIGFAEVLIDQAGMSGPSNFSDPLTRIRASARHLLRVINDILDLSKVEAGKLDLHLEAVELAPLVNDVVASFQPLALQNGNRIEIACPREIGSVAADPTRLRQVLLNLLSNASKFTDNGSILVTLERVAEAERDWLTIAVRDSGIGIAPVQIGRLFEPFSQADATITRKYGGTGLGLAISRRFCRLMGGDIAVQSRLGRGSTFTVRLPAGEPGPVRRETQP